LDRLAPEALILRLSPPFLAVLYLAQIKGRRKSSENSAFRTT
jgi:hypothetical protein